MLWFDTHFHIDLEKAPRAHDIIEGARQAQVGLMLLQGTSLEDCPQTISLAEQEDGVYATTGLHPHTADTPYDRAQFLELASHPKVKAIGEIGLDYYYDFGDRAKQRLMFADFLKLAVETNLPAVIHSRDAFEDTFTIVQDNLPPGHPFEIHSFTGTVDESLQWLQAGAMLSVNGMVTFKKADNVREILHHIPLDRLLLETDSPYLAPIPLRGQENTPANIPLIGAKVAEELGLSVEQVADLTTANGQRFFKIRN